MAKETAAKEAKEAQLLSFLQPQSVADHMRRDGIPKEDNSLIGSWWVGVTSFEHV